MAHLSFKALSYNQIKLVEPNPFIIAYPGNKKHNWYATIGHNLNDDWNEWNPPIELNCAKIWQDRYRNNASGFIDLLVKSLLHEFLHIHVRIEATLPPLGTGSIPLWWKGKREEKGIWRLVFLLLSERMPKSLRF